MESKTVLTAAHIDESLVKLQTLKEKKALYDQAKTAADVAKMRETAAFAELQAAHIDLNNYNEGLLMGVDNA